MSSPLSARGLHDPGPRGSILVVDDDDDIRAAVVASLTSMGHSVVEACDGARGLAVLAETQLDAILSDIAMPGMSGVEFLREVRSRNLDIPVVLMTGDPKLETAIRAVEYGAMNYLVKPVDRGALARTMTRAILLHRLAQARRSVMALAGNSGGPLGDRASLEACFERALATVWPAFQPIVRVRERQTYGFEALLRTRDEILASPADMINAAERLGRTQELGRIMRHRVAAELELFGADVQVFVNLHHDDLIDPALYDPDAPLTRHAARIVLEVTERASLDGLHDLPDRAQALRALGYRIAVDDLGAGYAGLSSLVRLQPEVVKIDMSLVRGVDHDISRARVIQHMARLCHDMGMGVIVEGIETAGERDTLLGLGCNLHQGYLYGRPAPRARAAPIFD
jgi:EAL domain-containing protein (putative c-di-GMP-specific phosphodiesterase class I)